MPLPPSAQFGFPLVNHSTLFAAVFVRQFVTVGSAL